MYLEVETNCQTRVSIYLKLCKEPLYMINECLGIEQGFRSYYFYVLSNHNVTDFGLSPLLNIGS
jgi:hypothetical protein